MQQRKLDFVSCCPPYTSFEKAFKVGLLFHREFGMELCMAIIDLERISERSLD